MPVNAPRSPLVATRGFGAEATGSEVTARETGKDVQVDLARNRFSVRHTWEVSATREELRAAARQLTLSGEAPIIGTAMVHASTPPGAQNRNGRIEAHGFRPVGCPEPLGSTVRVTPTHDGFVCQVRGPVGNGESRVTFGETFLRGGQPVTRVTEVGTYSLRPRLEGLLGLAAAPLNAFMDLTPMGRVGMAMAHKLMGELHNLVFDAGGALAAAVAAIRRRG
jgi:hypothetical protein